MQREQAALVQQCAQCGAQQVDPDRVVIAQRVGARLEPDAAPPRNQVTRDAWRFDEVAPHWDQLQVRAWIEEGGAEVLYQDGTLASLRSARELIGGYTGGPPLAGGTGMTCGTVAVIGGIRPASVFRMELRDPVLNRRIGHRYTIDVLPEVA